MASKRRLRRKTCEQKHRYDTEYAARQAIEAGTSLSLEPYPCRHCGGWHNGHHTGTWRREMFKNNGRGRRRPGVAV